jgi:hypothetical protein
MKLPIIVNESGDILIYRTVEQAECALEPIDVKNGAYVVYDSQGRRVSLSLVTEIKSTIFGFFSKTIEKVKIVEDPSAVSDEHGLRCMLVKFLSRANMSVGDVPVSGTIDLPDMDVLIDKIGYSN